MDAALVDTRPACSGNGANIDPLGLRTGIRIHRPPAAGSARPATVRTRRQLAYRRLLAARRRAPDVADALAHAIGSTTPARADVETDAAPDGTGSSGGLQSTHIGPRPPM